MNAGAHGGETWDTLTEAEGRRRDGTTAWLPKSAFRYGYRHVEFPADVIGFLAARFAFKPDVDGCAEADMKRWLARRKATQPVGRPTAGSTFRNPPIGRESGRARVCTAGWISVVADPVNKKKQKN